MIALDYEFATAQITRIVNNASDDTKKIHTIFANPYFPYMQENVGNITFANDEKLNSKMLALKSTT
jgi:hypothetical protein